MEKSSTEGNDENFFEDVNADNAGPNKNGVMACSLANVVRRSVDKRILSMDIVSKNGKRVSFMETAKFLRDVVNLEDKDVIGLKRSVFAGETAFMQVIMAYELDVNAKFEHNEGCFENSDLKLKIRGVTPKDTQLVIIQNPPDCITKAEMEENLKAVGFLETHVANDKFALNVPLFAGKVTGNWKSLITIPRDKGMPDSIQVKGVRIHLKWPQRKKNMRNSTKYIHNPRSKEGLTVCAPETTSCSPVCTPSSSSAKSVPQAMTNQEKIHETY